MYKVAVVLLLNVFLPCPCVALFAATVNFQVFGTVSRLRQRDPWSSQLCNAVNWMKFMLQAGFQQDALIAAEI